MKVTVSDLCDLCKKFNVDFDEIWIEDGFIFVKGSHWDGIDYPPNKYTITQVKNILSQEG